MTAKPPTAHPALSDRPSTNQRGPRAVEAFVEAGGDASAEAVRDLLVALGEHAPALLPLALGDVGLPADVLARPLDLPDTDADVRRRFLDATADLDDGPALRRVLRQLRHRALVRIALREVLRLADVDQTSAEMASLAGAAIDAALQACRRTLEARHGIARDGDGQRVPLVVLGMGKLGGRELNLGSDVDLCFFYGTDDATVGDGNDLTVHELYARVATRTTKALADVTEDGFCFRVDLRLRPEGSRGPVVNSLASAERYYESFGRTWERGALLRAEPVAGDLAFAEELMAVLRPFVFRRAVNPAIAREMADMLKRTRRDLRVDEEDVKLGRGGIREAEFFVQTLQLVWGGRHPELQVRGTVEALQRLEAAGLVTHRELEDFGAAWALLRRVEHRIHVWAGYQTHTLPAVGDERDAFAASLGFRHAAALERALSQARDRIADLFASLLEDGDHAETSPGLEALLDRVAEQAPPQEVADHVADVLPVRDPDEAASYLLRLGRHANAPLGPVARERAPELGVTLLREAMDAADPDMALRFLADFFARMGGPMGYDRVLAENPTLVRRMVGVFGASATLSTALVSHPEEVDEALVLGQAPSVDQIGAEHGTSPIAFEGSPPEPDVFVGALRSVKRQVTLQVGVAHIHGELDLGQVEDRLSALAECQIRAALRYATAEMVARYGEPQVEDPQGPPATMVLVGMGKLGGRELGFGGDLDLVFLYGSDGETRPPPEGRPITNAELFTRIGQRTMRLLSQPDVEGAGYETDTRLRPSGSQGMLVVSLRAFDNYHATKAASWERQALIRARPVAGDPTMATMVRERCERLAFEGEAPPGQELARLRARMERELSGEREDRYHPKLGYGALVDVELLVQWLQMRNGANPAVRVARTLDALKALRTGGYLAPEQAEALAAGLRFFRRVEQSLKLLDETREPVVPTRGPLPARLARRLGLRDRDGMRPREVLLATWRWHAGQVRGIFEGVVGPVGTTPPWEG